MLTINSVDPLDENYGGDHGTPIARHYINGYMQAVAPSISGLVLEFGRPTYARKCKCRYEIIDIDENNLSADIHADICQRPVRADLVERYDVIICTAVLQYVVNPDAAVTNMHAMLKSGGHLILAQQTMSRIDPLVPDIDRWRFTQHGLGLLMKEFSNLSLRPYGNVYAACAYIYGLPAERLDPDKLSYADPNHPVVTIAHGQKA